MLHPSALRERHGYHQVLRELSFTLGRGDRLGVLGINGSGKSSLLKLMARILPPMTGSVWIGGRVLPLISFGAGFPPDLTGEENAVLISLLHGRAPRETARAMDRIAGFADIGDYLSSPVRTYSDGMRSRLAFAIAASLPFDVLLIDEVLAVGDGRFQHKCIEWLHGIDWTQKALVLVSHDLNLIEALTTEAIWLSGGRIASRGASPGMVYAYKQWLGLV